MGAIGLPGGELAFEKGGDNWPGFEVSVEKFRMAFGMDDTRS